MEDNEFGELREGLKIIYEDIRCIKIILQFKYCELPGTSVELKCLKDILFFISTEDIFYCSQILKMRGTYPDELNQQIQNVVNLTDLFLT